MRKVSCQKCAPGFYKAVYCMRPRVSHTRFFSSEKCLPGKKWDGKIPKKPKSEATCQKCEPGFYQDEHSFDTECKLCPMDSYTNAKGLSECVPCDTAAEPSGSLPNTTTAKYRQKCYSKCHYVNVSALIKISC